jgi:hypothetical protein
MVDPNTLQFIDMRNIVHTDEKWFNSTQKVKKFYMLPEEGGPLRIVHNKNYIRKCMVLCAVTEP